MEIYPGDVMSGAAFVLAALLLTLAGTTYVRLRIRSLLAPLIASAVVLAVSLLQILLGLLASRAPGYVDLTVSLLVLVVMMGLYVHWLAGRSARRGANGRTG